MDEKKPARPLANSCLSLDSIKNYTPISCIYYSIQVFAFAGVLVGLLMSGCAL